MSAGSPRDAVEALRRDIDSLRQCNEELLARAVDAEQALEALARGEVDAVALGSVATPVLLLAAQEKLQRSEQMFRALFDGALDAILLADDRGDYLDANPAACLLFGLSRAEIVGRNVAEFAASGYDVDGARDAFAEVGQQRGHFALQRPDGIRRTLEYAAVANVVPGVHLSVLRDVTERLAAQDALRQSEARFRAVIEKSSEVISLTKADGTTRYLTPSIYALLGWTPEEMEAGVRTMRDQVVPEDRVRIAEALERLIRTGERDMSLEFRVQRRDGGTLWIESFGTNLLEDPDVRAVVGNYRDITARKLADAALLESRGLLEEAQAIAHVGSWAVDVGQRMELRCSDECYRIFGLAIGAPVTAEYFLSLVHSADREPVREAIQQAVSGVAPLDFEHRVQLPDGDVRWIHLRAVVERDDVEQKLHVSGTAQDVTARVLSVEALRVSEQRYRRIVESTSEGVWVYDADGVTTFMNARMAEMLGYSVAEAVGQPMSSFLEPSGRAHLEARLARPMQGTTERSDFELRCKDGSELWVSVQANPLYDANGSFEGVISVLTDVSAQRRADDARARLAAIVDSSDDAIVSVSLDGAITSWNLGAERLYQYSSAEVIGKSMSLLLPVALLGEEQQLLDGVALGQPVSHHETTRRRKDGSEVEVGLTLSPIRDGAGSVIGVSKIERDLTTRREAEALHLRTEEQFRQAQKMEAVGRLAGGVAHDFNNLLSVILSYAEFALELLRPGDPLRTDIEEIRTAGKRATALTRQLLAFSRQQVLQPRVVDLDQILAGMESMLGRLVGEDVEVTICAAQHAGRVLADPGQIEQIVMNLVVNARDAMPDGGKLRLETFSVTVDAEFARSHLGVATGDYVMLAVSDTGSGMDAATRARIFEPFFTTKEKGKGTGLGLSTVFGIAQQSGGYVDVHSEPGQGSAFKVYFPRTGRATDVPPPEARWATRGGTETVLLVEDEDQVRIVACAILRRNGYHVLEASNGGEALLISMEFDAAIHLLLTDVVMPRMSGRRLVEQLAPQRPAMKVLFASGYTDDAIVHHGVLDAAVAFLQKPFTPDALLRKIREVLDAAQPVERELGAPS